MAVEKKNIEIVRLLLADKRLEINQTYISSYHSIKFSENISLYW